MREVHWGIREEITDKGVAVVEVWMDIWSSRIGLRRDYICVR